MTGVQVILSAAGGVFFGVAITALRWAIVRRYAAPPSIPPSADVLEAERNHPTQTPLTDRRIR